MDHSCFKTCWQLEVKRVSKMLKSLRNAMKEAGCDAYFVPRGDMFGGEEVRPADDRLAQLTGFTGSAGYALIRQDSAAVFSDSRYTVQLQRQLDTQIFDGFDAAHTSISTWLGSAADGLVIGYDGWVMSVAQMERLAKQIPAAEWHMIDGNLVDASWQDRPEYEKREVWQMPDAQAGKTATQKISEAAKHLADAQLDGQLITAPDSVNWLINMRGHDLAHTPLHLCFGLLHSSGDLQLIGADADASDWGYEIHGFDALAALLSSFSGLTLLMDKSSCPQAVAALAEAAGISIKWQADPIETAKAIKSPAEIDGFRAAHISDALAFLAFWHWLETEADLAVLREADLAVHLTNFRAANPDFLCESFPAIIGFKDNGAVVHYRAVSGSDAALTDGGVLLIDSGGHYRSGTTDITRSFALMGTAPKEAITASSHVLAAHITLAQTKFPVGTTGAQLDAICRTPLWAHNMDYGHGTGHGVGHVLSVHEGPMSISKRGQLPIEAGHLLSNEPGYYQEGAFGIRHENLVLAIEDKDGFLAFETITYVPFDLALVDASVLSGPQLEWLNNYHSDIYNMLSPFLSVSMADWLKTKTAAIG